MRNLIIECAYPREKYTEYKHVWRWQIYSSFQNLKKANVKIQCIIDWARVCILISYILERNLLQTNHFNAI